MTDFTCREMFFVENGLIVQISKFTKYSSLFHVKHGLCLFSALFHVKHRFYYLT